MQERDGLSGEESHYHGEEPHEQQGDDDEEGHGGEQQRLVHLQVIEQPARHELAPRPELPEDYAAKDEHDGVEVVAMEEGQGIRPGGLDPLHDDSALRAQHRGGYEQPKAQKPGARRQQEDVEGQYEWQQAEAGDPGEVGQQSRQRDDPYGQQRSHHNGHGGHGRALQEVYPGELDDADAARPEHGRVPLAAPGQVHDDRRQVEQYRHTHQRQQEQQRDLGEEAAALDGLYRR